MERLAPRILEQEAVNILLVNYEYPPIGGGAATAAAAIAGELTALGHRVTVLTSRFQNYKGTSWQDEVRIVRCPALRRLPDRSGLLEMLSFLVSAGLRLNSVIKSCQIEAAIVFFSFPCGPLGLWGRMRKGVPYVISLRGGDVPGNEAALAPLHRLLTPLRRLIFRKSIAVVANSEGLKAMSERADPCPVRVIPNGVDTEFFTPSASRQESKAGPFAFLFVGRFQIAKNLFYLFDHMALLKRSGAAPFVLHLVGDGPQREELEAHGKKGGIDNDLVWHGWVDKGRLRELYRDVDCLINPSLCEGMPNVVLEAMACGLPVIASRVPGNDAVVWHGESGWLFELDKPEAFLAALRGVMENPDLARRMGQAGRAWVLEDFSWRRVAEAYADLLTTPEDRCPGGCAVPKMERPLSRFRSSGPADRR